MAIRDIRGGDLDPNLRSLDLSGTTDEGDSTDQANEKTPEQLAIELAKLPLTPITIPRPAPPQPGIVSDNPRRARQEKAYEDESWFQTHMEAKAERLRQEKLNADLQAAGQAASTPGVTPTDQTGPVTATQETVDQELFDTRDEDPLALQEETPAQQIDRFYKDTVRKQNERVIEQGQEIVDRAFGDIPEEVRQTEASDELTEANLAAVDPALQRQLAKDIREGRSVFREASSLFTDRAQMILSGLVGTAGAIVKALPFTLQPAFVAPINDPETIQSVSESNKKRMIELAKMAQSDEGTFNEIGNSIQDFAENVAPNNPELRESFEGMVWQGVGSTGAFIVPSLLFGPIYGTVLGGTFGSSAARSEAVDAAIQGGATPEQIVEAQGLPGLVGYLEVMPLEGAITRAGLRAVGKTAAKKIMDRTAGRMVVNVAANTAEEFVQEGSQQLSQNYAAQTSYNPEISLLDNVGTSAGVGGATGFLMSVALTAAGAGRARRMRLRGERAVQDAIANVPSTSSAELFAVGVEMANTEGESALEIRKATMAELDSRSVMIPKEDLIGKLNQPSDVQDVLDVLEGKGVTAENSIFVATDEAGAAEAVVVGRDNIETFLNNVLAKKEDAFTEIPGPRQEEGGQEVTPTEEAGPQAEQPVTEEGVAEEVTDDPVRNALITFTDNEGNFQQVEGVTHLKAVENATELGIMDVDQDGDPVLPDDYNGDLFITESGEVIDRVEVKARTGKAAAENIIVDTGAEREAELRIEAKAREVKEDAPVLEETDVEALYQELEAIDEEIGELEALADNRDSGELTEEERDRLFELQQRQTEVQAKIPSTPTTDEEYVDQLKEFEKIGAEQKQMSVKGLQKFLMPELSIWTPTDIERMLEIDSEQKVLPPKMRRALRGILGTMRGQTKAVTEEAPVIEEPVTPPPPPVKAETKAEKEARIISDLTNDMLAVNEGEAPKFRQGKPMRLSEEVWQPLLQWALAKNQGRETRVLTRKINRLLQEHEAYSLSEIVNNNRPLFPASVGALETISDKAAADVARQINSTTNALDQQEVNALAMPFHGMWEIYTQHFDIAKIGEALKAMGAPINVVEAVNAAADSHENYYAEPYNRVVELFQAAEDEYFSGQVAEWQTKDSKINWNRSVGVGATPNQEKSETFRKTVMRSEQFLALVPTATNLDDVGYAEANIMEGDPISPPYLTVQREDTHWRVVEHGGRGRALAVESADPGSRIPVDVFYLDKKGDLIPRQSLSTVDAEREIRGEESENYAVKVWEDGWVSTEATAEEVVDAEPVTVGEELAPELVAALEEVKTPNQGVGTPDSENVVARTIDPEPGVNTFTAEEIQTEVTNSMLRLKLPTDVAEIVVVEKSTDVASMGYDPRNVRSVDPNSGALITSRAFLDLTTNRVIFVAENMKANEPLVDQIDKLIAHEVVVHLGLRKMFGDQFVTKMAEFYDTTQNKSRFVSIIEDYAFQLETVTGLNVEAEGITAQDIITGGVLITERSKSIIMEETFANFAEDEAFSQLRTFRTGDPALSRAFKAFKNFLRNMFRRFGFTTQFSDDAMSDLIMTSAANLRKSAGTATEQDLARLGRQWQLANNNDQETFEEIVSMVSEWSEATTDAYMNNEIWPGALVGMIERNGGIDARDTILDLTDAAIGYRRNKTERKQRGIDYNAQRYKSSDPNLVFSRTKTASIAGTRLNVQNHDAQTQWGKYGVNSPYFRKWFGNSQVVDENGEPLVVHHGTANKFYQFNTDLGALGMYGPGVYFTSRKDEAKVYAGYRMLLGDPGVASFTNAPTVEEMGTVAEAVKRGIQRSYRQREQQFPAFDQESADEFADRLRRADNVKAIKWSDFVEAGAGFLLRDGSAVQIGKYEMHTTVMQNMMFPTTRGGGKRLVELAEETLGDPSYSGNPLEFGLSMTGALRFSTGFTAGQMNIEIIGDPSSTQKSMIARRMKDGLEDGMFIEYSAMNGETVSMKVTNNRELNDFWREVEKAKKKPSIANDTVVEWDSYFNNNPDVLSNPDKFMTLMQINSDLLPVLNNVRDTVEFALGRKFETATDISVPNGVYSSYLSLQTPIDFRTVESEDVLEKIVMNLAGSRSVFKKLQKQFKDWRNTKSLHEITGPIDWAADALMASETVNGRFRTTVGKPLGRADAMGIIRRELQRAGYDGIIAPGTNSADHYVAWSPEQIKLQDNLGTFDPKNPDIRFSRSKTVTPPFNAEGVKDLLDQLEAKIIVLEQKIPTLKTKKETTQAKRDAERLRVERDRVLSMLTVKDDSARSAKAVDVENAEIDERYIEQLNALQSGEGASEVDIMQGVIAWNEGARDLDSFIRNMPKSVKNPEIVFSAVMNRVLSNNAMGQVDNSARSDHKDFNEYQGERSDNVEEADLIEEIPSNLRVTIEDVEVTKALSVMDDDRIMRRVNERIISTANRYRGKGWLGLENWSISKIEASFTKGGSARIANYGGKLKEAMRDIRIPQLANIRQTSQASEEAIAYFEQVLDEAINGREEFMFTDSEQELLREVYSDFVLPKGANNPTKKLWADIRKAVFEPSISIKITWKKNSYTFHNTDGRPGVPEAAPGNSTMREEVWADIMAKRVAQTVGQIAQRALDGDPVAQNMLRQRRWYTNMRAVLRHKYGATGELFADLLGATSARQAVDENYQQATEAMDIFFTGAYDPMLEVYERYLVYKDMAVERKQLQDGDLKRANKSGDEVRIAAAQEAVDRITARIEKYLANNADIQLNAKGRWDGPVALKKNGKKFGINSEAVMRALVNVYRIVRAGQTPKTRNFTGNLIGYSDEATVDVWAARFMQRMAGDERIPPPVENGVTGSINKDMTPGGQFGFGQLVFKLATDRINSGAFASIRKYNKEVGDNTFVAAPHELQALLWFAEKEVWTAEGWTTVAGEGGSFEHAAAKRQSDRFSIISADNDAIVSALVDDETNRSAIVANPTLALVDGEVVETGFVEIMGTENIDPAELAVAALDKALQSGEQNVILSRVLQNSEINDNARPGAQIAFREGVPLERAEALLRWIKSQGVTHAFLLRDARTSLNKFDQSQEGLAFGIQIMTIPEIDVQHDRKLANILTTEKRVDGHIERQRRNVVQILKRVRDQAAKSEIDVTMALYELHDVLAINEVDYVEERERFTEIVATGSAAGAGTPASRRSLTGAWGVTRNGSILQRAADWRGESAASNIAKATTQEAIRTVKEQLNSGDSNEVLKGAQWVLRELGGQTIDVKKAFEKWQMNMPAYIEEYASLWENIQAADILSIPTRKKGETDEQLHRRQFERGLQSIREVLVENVAFDPIDVTAGTTFVQVPYMSNAPINLLLEFALLEATRVTASQHVPTVSDPVLHIDATLRRMRKQLEDIEVPISNREFARFYQTEMGRSLLETLGVTDMTMSQLGFVSRPRSTVNVMQTAQALYETLKPQASENTEIRYSRRTEPAPVEWVDNAGRQRRTVRNMTMDEVQSHVAYAPEAAEKTQVTNTARTYQRLAETYLSTDENILDYGGGLGAGTATLRELGFRTDLYEPYSNPNRRVMEPDFERTDAADVPDGYDKVLSTFVLNVVPQDVRDFIVEKAVSRLKVGGEAIFLARPWSSVKETLKTKGTVDLGNRQVLTTKGTYQRGYINSVELAQEIEDILGPENFVVQAEPKGPAVRVLKLSEPQPGNSDIRYARTIEEPADSNWDRLIDDADQRIEIKNRDLQDMMELMGGRESRRPVGAPEYANNGTTEETRMGQDKVDDIRKAQNQPNLREQAAARAEAAELLADPETRADLIQRINDGIVSNSDVEAAASAMLIDESWAQAYESMDEAEVERVMMLTSRLRTNRGNLARALAIGRDPLKTPAERHHDMIKRVIYTYPPFERLNILLEEELRKSGGIETSSSVKITRSLKRAMKFQRRRMQAFMTLMQRHGYDITALPESLLADENQVIALMDVLHAGEVSETTELLKAIKNGEFKELPARWRDFIGQNWADKLLEFRINALLSSPRTFVRNNVSNTFRFLAEHGAIRPIQGKLNEIRNQRAKLAGWLAEKNLAQDPESTRGLRLQKKAELLALTDDDVRWGETMKMVGYMWSNKKMVARAFIKANRRAMLAFRREMPVVENLVLPGSKATSRFEQHENRRAIKGKLGRAIRVPGRTLIHNDEFIKSLEIDFEVGVLAHRLGRRKGLKGDQLDQYVLEQTFDVSSESHAAIMEDAVYTAKKLTFQTPLDARDDGKHMNWLDKIGVTVIKLRQDKEMGHGIAHIMPFITVPVNLRREVLKGVPFIMAPVVAKRLLWNSVSDTYTYDISKRYEDYSWVIFGTAMLTGLAMLIGAYDDEDDPAFALTGNPVPFDVGDPTAMKEYYMEQTHARPPMSVKILGKWISYEGVEPLSGHIATSVDTFNAWMKSKEGSPMDEVMVEFIKDMYKNSVGATYMEGLDQFIQAVSNPKNALYYISNFMSSFSPNIMRTTVRSFDEHSEIMDTTVRGEGIVNKLKSAAGRTVRNALPIRAFASELRVDPLGRSTIRDDGAPFTDNPVANGIYRGILPFNVHSVDKGHPVFEAYAQFNAKQLYADNKKYPPMPSRNASIDGVEYDMANSKQEYQELARLTGVAAREQLEEVIRRGKIDVYNPTERDMEYIQKVFTKSRTMAIKRMRSLGLTNPFQSPEYVRHFSEDNRVDEEKMLKIVNRSLEKQVKRLDRNYRNQQTPERMAAFDEALAQIRTGELRFLPIEFRPGDIPQPPEEFRP